MFRRRAQIGDFVEGRIVVVGMSSDEAVPDPTDERGFMDSEPRSGLWSRQHATIFQSVATGAEPVSLSEI